MPEITEKKMRQIAREEALKVTKQSIKELVGKVEELEESLRVNTEILQRLDRLLLGELGVDSEDTLKARAIYAFNYAKKNTEIRVVERAIPALEWFERWNRKEPGCKESKLHTLGRMIGLFTKIEWVLALLGITTVINALPVIKMVAEWINNFS